MLPLIQDDNLNFMKMQTQWKQQIEPSLDSIFKDAKVLSGIDIKIGDNTIEHKLGKKLTGWFVVGSSSLSNIYDKQGPNQTTDKTLILNSSSTAKINLIVF